MHLIRDAILARFVTEATVFARGREFMARDADPATALNAAMHGLARLLEMER